MPVSAVRRAPKKSGYEDYEESLMQPFSYERQPQIAHSEHVQTFDPICPGAVPRECCPDCAERRWGDILPLPMRAGRFVMLVVSMFAAIRREG